jgi:hypothetical protein
MAKSTKQAVGGKLFIPPTTSRLGKPRSNEELKTDHGKWVTLDEYFAELETAPALHWPERRRDLELRLNKVAGDAPAALARRTELACRESRWEDAARYAGILHARTLKPVPFDDLQWPVELQKKLDEVHRWFAIAVEGRRSPSAYRGGRPPPPEDDGLPPARLPRAERVLRVLCTSLGYGPGTETGDDAILKKLDKVAGRYLRDRTKADLVLVHGIAMRRPAAARLLRDWWAGQLAVRIESERKPNSHGGRLPLEKVPVDTCRDLASFFLDEIQGEAAFDEVTTDLPKGWRSKPAVEKLRKALCGLVDREIVGRETVDFEELGERMARSSLGALGYPPAKTKSLFDSESKEKKAEARRH